MSTREGIVYNIQRFSIHDGPGIRTTVFLKGCPLDCFWCSNPESQQRDPQLMLREVKCSRCGECAKVCPLQNISFSDDRQIRSMSWESCQSCFQCVDACIYQALTVMGETKSVEEVMTIVESDRVFYKNSGGGVTFSGGEPLMQADYLKELMISAKEKGFHVTLDTTGLAPSAAFDKVRDFIDLVLFDIKHLNDREHRRYTGVSNKVVLENLGIISADTETWIRIPLINGINDDEAHIKDIADLAHDLGIKKISLLPYHEGGISKRQQIGMKKSKYEGRAPTDDHVKFLSSIIVSKGLEAGVGS